MSQFELSFSLYGPRFLGAGALASIKPTIQALSCSVSDTPAAIAGVRLGGVPRNFAFESDGPFVHDRLVRHFERFDQFCWQRIVFGRAADIHRANHPTGAGTAGVTLFVLIYADLSGLGFDKRGFLG